MKARCRGYVWWPLVSPKPSSGLPYLVLGGRKAEVYTKSSAAKLISVRIGPT
jgi:hypothetical protein